MLDPAILKYTKANVPLVSNRVSNDIASRTVEKPYITFELINTNFINSMSSSSGLAEAVVRFHAFAETKHGANQVIAELKTAYRNYFSTGLMSGEHLVQTTMLSNETNIRYETDTKLFHGVLEVIFWHIE